MRMSSIHRRLSWRTANPDSPFHTAVLVVLVAILSYLCARLGGSLVLRPQMIWPIWPGCAFLVAVLLLVRRRIWPILIAAGFAGFILYDLRAGLALRSTAFLILADTLEVLIAALGVSYCFAGVPRLNSLKSLAKYSVFAVILAPVTTAFISTVILSGDYWLRWRTSFFTEALALFTLTPAILSWVSTRQEWTKKPRAYYLEAVALIAGLVLLGSIAFATPGRINSPVLLYSLLPFLLWSALRFGLMGISTSMIVVAFLSTWGAVHGRGPFTVSEPLNNVMSLQLFLFFAATPFMVLAVLVEERKQADQSLRESEKRFRLLADTAPALIWMADTDKLCTYFNQPWLDFTGRSIDQEIGHGWAEGVHSGDLPKCMDTYTQAFDRREKFRMEYRLRRHDGEYRWIIDIGVPRFNPDRSFIGYIGIGVDVTERKHAEEALKTSEEKFSKAFRQSPMLVTLTSIKDSRYIDVNEAFERVTGWHRDQVIGRTPSDIEFWVDPEERVKLTNRLLTEGHLTEMETRFRMRDGSIRIGSATAELIELNGEPCMLGVGVDITERKRAEEALSTMSRRLIEAQEKERIRIARELHDDMGQRLALLTNELEQIQQTFPDLDVAVRSRISEAQKNTSQIATDIQSLSHELHSSKLQYLGLAAAMKGFCREFGEQQKVKIDFKSYDVPSPLSPDISLCLFRVLQEALNNSIKHSGVRHVDVRLWGTSDEIHLTVSDSGAGFDSQAAKQGRGLGLVSMEERLKLLDGKFSIESQPNRGATIHARLPLTSGSDFMRAAG